MILGQSFDICFGERGEVFHQVAVDEDVAAADFSKEDALDAVVEKGNEAEGKLASAPEYKTEGEVLDDCPAAKKKPY
jgi:hypothetical protein